MAQTKYKSPYDCPICGWESGGEYDDIFLEECYYKLEGDQLKVISVEDLREVEQDPPEDYYPKFGPTYPYSTVDGSGYDWKETWLCPHCKKEFSFVNGT
jgi:rubredoxin